LTNALQIGVNVYSMDTRYILCCNGTTILSFFIIQQTM